MRFGAINVSQLRIPVVVLMAIAQMGSRVTAAPDTAELMDQLRSESFEQRTEARKSLVESITDLRSPLLTELAAARYAEDPEVRLQASDAMHEVFQRLVLGFGKRELGVKWSYWFDYQDGKTLTYPMVLEIQRKGFMAAAGFKVGDVLESCEGQSLSSRGSVAMIRDLLEKALPGQPLVCKVMRAKPKLPFSERVKNLNITVKPNDVKSTGRKEQPGEYEAWLQSLGKAGTVPVAK